MACENERRAWEQADEALKSSIEAHQQAQAALVQAKQNTLAAQNAENQAEADELAAEQNKNIAAGVARDAYEAYLDCVISDGTAPPEEINAAMVSLNALRMSL